MNSVSPYPKPERAPLHPICMSLYPIAATFAQHLANEALPRPPVDALLLPAAYSLVMTGIVWSLARVFIQNLQRSALFASVWSVAFFTFGRVAAVVPPGLVALMWVGIVAMSGWTLSKSRTNPRVTSGLLNLTSTAMLMLPLITTLTQLGIVPIGKPADPNRAIGTIEEFNAAVLAMTPLPTLFNAD